VFFVVHWIPGDPAIGILGAGENRGDLQRLRIQLGLERPLTEQYTDFLGDILQGDLGVSFYTRQKVAGSIRMYFPNTLQLAVFSLLIAVMLAFPAGILAAYRENSPLDVTIGFIGTSGLALPNFFAGPLLVLLFSINLGWLPVSGSDGLRYLVLPSFTLGISMTALLTRIVRKSVLLELRKPYVLLARAKGLPESSILRIHVLKNAMIPIITTMGMQMGYLLSGAIVTETIFSWQGIGVLLVKSLTRRDYPMVQGIVVFISFLYLLINFLVDLSYFFFDPRRTAHGA
jgi:peptide/nickel transport system permease protein